MFRNSILKLNKLSRISKFNVSNNRHHSMFDINLDWFSRLIFTKTFTLTNAFIGLNISLFLYVNNYLRSESSRFNKLEGVSYSINTLHLKEYSGLFISLLGNRRLDDLIFDCGVLFTLGNYLEKFHGRPFIIKMFLFSYYIGMLSSMFWVRSESSQKSRYHVEDPLKRGINNEYRYMSTHGFSMSLVYFFVFKKMKFLVLPIVFIDYMVWSPFYLQGLLTGAAAGIIL